MTELPAELWRAEQVREFDRIAIEEEGIPGFRLMSRAGRATWAAAAARWPRARRVAVICGGGNNGGDGYVVARLAQEAGLEVTLFHVGDPTRLTGDALTAAQAARKAGLEPRPYEGDDLGEFDLLVDALLGTGLNGEVHGSARAAIEAMNKAGRPVVAVDIPSGLHADTGAVLGVAVGASVTVTFIGLKVGLFTGEGPDRAGEVVFHDLEVPARVHATARPAATRLSAARELPERLPPRARTLHKGGAGHVLVIGGDTGLLGAVRMAGEAAARTGAGLVSLATRHTHAPLIAAACPFLMAHGVERGEDLAELVERANVVAVGPGLGQELWGRALLEVVMTAGRPLVVDADALNLLAEAPRQRADWVLTPHPGEAARLLDTEVGAIQSDRPAAAAGIQERYQGVCVLKGAGTVVQGAAEEPPAIAVDGNPGMAVGGMGDLLTGVIAALMAQGLSPEAAARTGVALHAAAGDAAAGEGGERGLVPTDLLPWLRRLANPEGGAP